MWNSLEKEFDDTKGTNCHTLKNVEKSFTICASLDRTGKKKPPGIN